MDTVKPFFNKWGISCSNLTLLLVLDDLLIYKLPEAYRPGSDVLSKNVAKHQVVIDLVTKSLLNVADNTYCIAPTEWPDTMRCDVLFLPRLALERDLPPIILEIQCTINQDYMSCAIQYCLYAYRVYKKLPILMTICIEKVSPSSLMDTFKSCVEQQLMYEMPCAFWANRCLLLLSWTKCFPS